MITRLVSGCSVINSSICSHSPSDQDFDRVAKWRLSGASSVRSINRCWIQLRLSSKHSNSTVPLSVCKFQNGLPCATRRESRSSSHDFPVLAAPARMCNPCGNRLSTTNRICGSCISSRIYPSIVLIFSFFILFSFPEFWFSFDSDCRTIICASAPS